MSIQLALNGLSFSVVHNGAILSGGYCLCNQGECMAQMLERLSGSEPWMRVDYAEVRVLIDTPSVVLIPGELYTKSSEEALLTANGVAVDDSRKILRSDSQSSVVAVMTLEKESYTQLKRCFTKAKLSFSHPLILAMRSPRSGDLLEVIQGEHASSLVLTKQGRVVFAETTPDTESATLLWSLQQLSRVHALSSPRILLSGVECKPLYELLNPYYKELERIPLPKLPNELKPLQERIPFANMIRLSL